MASNTERDLPTCESSFMLAQKCPQSPRFQSREERIRPIISGKCTSWKAAGRAPERQRGCTRNVAVDGGLLGRRPRRASSSRLHQGRTSHALSASSFTAHNTCWLKSAQRWLLLHARVCSLCAPSASVCNVTLARHACLFVVQNVDMLSDCCMQQARLPSMPSCTSPSLSPKWRHSFLESA